MTADKTNVSSYPINQSAAPFVGRSAELDRLSHLVTEAADCHMKTVFITGEAGIGKTRLAQELVHKAQRHGWQIWKGHADLTNKKIPFSTLLQVLRMAVTQLPSDEQMALTTEIPNIGRLLPGFDGGKPEIEYDLRWDRIQLFETFRSIAVKLSHKRPTVVWLDDFPEADVETIDWVHYLIRQEQQTCILFVATCRTPIPKAPPEYRKLYTTLNRYHQLEEIQLHPFHLRETTALARELLVGDVEERMLRLVQDRTRGIPLFAVELMRMLGENGHLVIHEGKWDIAAGTQHKVPKAVSSVISERIAHLSKLQRDILHLLAVSNVPLPWSLLQTSTGATPPSLVTSLSGLVQLAILDENSSTADIVYSFSHPMIQEVVFGEISATTARHLHHILAAAWEDPVRAAYHIRRAGSMADVHEAIRVLVEAGRYHLSMRAYQVAREHLETAVELAQQSAQSVADDLNQEAKILLCEAWAYSERVSDPLEILEDFSLHAPSASSKIRIKRLMASIESTRLVANCISHIEDGLLSWDGHSENEDVFWMLNEQMFNYLNSDAVAEAGRILTRLRHYCELHPSPKHSLVLAIREAHMQLFDWRGGQGQVLDPGTLILQARALGDPEWIYDVYGLLGYSSLNQGDHGTTVRYWKECMPLVQRYGMATYEYALTIMGSCGLFLAGDWEQALAELDTVERMAREYSIDLALAAALDQKAVIYALRGQWSKALACTAETREITLRSIPLTPRVNDPYVIHAVTALQMVVDDISASVPESTSVVWANIHGLPIFLKLLEGITQIRSGSVHTVERLIAELHAAAGDDVNYAKGALDLLAGLVSNHRGEVLPAMERIEDAIKTFDFLGIPLESAIARLEWSAISALQQPKEAEVCGQRALTIFRQLDAKPYVQRAESVLKMIQAVRMDRMTSASISSLSERQREIVLYISKGLSNKEIAETLVLSRRTVDAHVNNIYKRLGVRSRVALLHRIDPR